MNLFAICQSHEVLTWKPRHKRDRVHFANFYRFGVYLLGVMSSGPIKKSSTWVHWKVWHSNGRIEGPRKNVFWNAREGVRVSWFGHASEGTRSLPWSFCTENKMVSSTLIRYRTNFSLLLKICPSADLHARQVSKSSFNCCKKVAPE